MLFLSDLPTNTWHTLPVYVRIAYLQNAVVRLLGGVDRYHLLTPEEIQEEELATVHRLISDHRLVGAFASTFFEDRYRWMNYIHPMDEDTVQLFNQAVDRRLWERYTGVIDYVMDPDSYSSHVMGEVVHGLSLILEAHLNITDQFNSMMSPAHLIPPYRSVHLERFANGLFAGAFSPVSARDIAAIRGMLGGNQQMTIMDIRRGVTPQFVEHYGMEFVRDNALESRLPPGSFDLIMSNCLVQSAASDGNFEPYEAWEHFLREAHRLLQPGGMIVLTERPYPDWECEGDALRQSIEADRLALLKLITECGFHEPDVSYAERFSDRKAVERYLLRGVFDPNEVVTCEGTGTIFLVTATK